MIEHTPGLSTWLAERKTGLGSTDAAPSVGLCPWRTALDVYLEHIGEAQPREISEAMEMGTLLEPVVAELYQRRTGEALEAAPPIIRHPDRPWQLASLDRRRRDNDRRIVELKTAGQWLTSEWGESGTDAIPDHYVLQVVHQMVVSQTEIADVAVLLAGQEFRVYTIDLNQDLAAILTEREAELWDRIQRRDPPEPDWEHSSTSRVVGAMRGFRCAEITLGDDILEQVAEYKRLGAEIRAMEKDRDTLKGKVMFAMADATHARLPDHTLLERKPITCKEHTVKEHTYIKLQIHEPKIKKLRERSAV